MRSLAVIVGAGASFDCADASAHDIDPDWRPPLVCDLFAKTHAVSSILRKYPKVAALSSQIRDRLAGKESIEDVLRDLVSVQSDAIRRQCWDVPLYLQELLGTVSNNFARGGSTRYDTLVSFIERSSYERVLYITVNYDSFLETSLSNLYDVSLRHIDDYCHPNRKWSLVKLHGSVNWGRKLLRGTIDNNGLHLGGAPLDLDKEISVLAGHSGSNRIVEGAHYYPALSIPIGGKEEFSCPRAHIDFMDERLTRCSGFLFIGFSGFDSHVLRKFKPIKQFSRLSIVTKDHDEGRGMLARLAASCDAFRGVLIEDVAPPSGFGDFVRNGQLRNFLSVL